MFYEASAFHQNLCSWGSTMGSTTPSVTDMFLLSGCPDKSEPNTGLTPVTPLCFACYPAINSKTELVSAVNAWISSTDTTYGPTINEWDVSRVDDFSSLFSFYPAFNDNISGWQTSQVTNMGSMF